MPTCARGCHEDSGCELLVDSDGRENVEQQIKQALTGTANREAKLPAKISNEGIKVEISGLAATTSPPTRLADQA